VRAYIASALENADNVRELRDLLAARGIELTHDWTVHGSVKDQGIERIREVAENELRGVAAADLVIVLLPGGRGTHIEFGIALATRRKWPHTKIVIFGQQPDETGREPCFYELVFRRWLMADHNHAHPLFVIATLEEHGLIPTLAAASR
jgi:hypothetical protein